MLGGFIEDVASGTKDIDSQPSKYPYYVFRFHIHVILELLGIISDYEASCIRTSY